MQTASAVLCYSRMLFFQCYPNFRRFDCKVFLTDALRYMGGATARVMIDNTHVVVLRGSGRDMVPVPEMAAFGERFGFQFVAHAIGNANRSQRVERPFSFIEGNFRAEALKGGHPAFPRCRAGLLGSTLYVTRSSMDVKPRHRDRRWLRRNLARWDNSILPLAPLAATSLWATSRQGDFLSPCIFFVEQGCRPPKKSSTKF